MKNFFTLVVVLFLSFSIKVGAAGWDFIEDFTNSNLTTSYANGSFVGNNDITWTYVASRDENGDANSSGIVGKACMLRRASDVSSISSSTVSTGISSFEMKLYKGFTGAGNRQVELFVNGVSKGVSTEFDDFDMHTFTVNDINEPGDVVIEVRNITAKQVIIDDISWTSFVGVVKKVATPKFSPDGGVFQTPQAVTISSDTLGAAIYYTLDGTDPSETSTLYAAPIVVSESTTIKAIAYKEGLDASSIVTATYTFPVVVNTVAELRAQTAGTSAVYVLTGEVVLTYQQAFRNQKFLQDATGGIMIDDPSGIISTTYNEYDGITGIAGTLVEFGGMLEFVPSANTLPATSTNNTIVIPDVSIDDLNTNFEMYESKLVTIKDVVFPVTNVKVDTTFAKGKAYEFTSDSKTGMFRTTFYDADYIGTIIPSSTVSITGIFNSRSDGNYITARSAADISVATSIATQLATKDVKVYGANGVIQIKLNEVSSADMVSVYDLSGKRVVNQLLNNKSTSLTMANKGVYIVRLTVSGVITPVKVILR